MKKRKPRPSRVAPALLDRVIVALVRNVTPTELCAQAARFEATPAAMRAAIKEAQRQITLSARFNRDAELGTAYRRLNDVYKTSTAIQDAKTALTAQRELNKLLRLYDAAPTLAPAGQADDQDAALARRHLRAAGLGTDDDTLGELARLAVEALIRSPQT